MVALVTLGILILIWTIPLIHYLHHLLALIHMSDVAIKLCGGWILLVRLVRVSLMSRLTMKLCWQSGTRAPEPFTPGPIGIAFMVILIVVSGILLLFLYGSGGWGIQLV